MKLKEKSDFFPTIKGFQKRQGIKSIGLNKNINFATEISTKKMAKNNILVAPFLKWVGGKRQIMPSIVNLLPKNIKELPGNCRRISDRTDKRISGRSVFCPYVSSDRIQRSK